MPRDLRCVAVEAGGIHLERIHGAEVAGVDLHHVRSVAEVGEVEGIGLVGELRRQDVLVDVCAVDRHLQEGIVAVPGEQGEIASHERKPEIGIAVDQVLAHDIPFVGIVLLNLAPVVLVGVMEATAVIIQRGVVPTHFQRLPIPDVDEVGAEGAGDGCDRNRVGTGDQFIEVDAADAAVGVGNRSIEGPLRLAIDVDFGHTPVDEPHADPCPFELQGERAPNRAAGVVPAAGLEETALHRPALRHRACRIAVVP